MNRTQLTVSTVDWSAWLLKHQEAASDLLALMKKDNGMVTRTGEMGRPFHGSKHPYMDPPEVREWKNLLFNKEHIGTNERWCSNGKFPARLAEDQSDMPDSNHLRLDNGLIAYLNREFEGWDEMPPPVPLEKISEGD